MLAASAPSSVQIRYCNAPSRLLFRRISIFDGPVVAALGSPALASWYIGFKSGTMYVQLEGKTLSHNKTQALLNRIMTQIWWGVTLARNTTMEIELIKTILSQASPSEVQQQLHVVVKASAADECTRMAHTKNKKLPKMARRISFDQIQLAVHLGVTGWASLNCVHSLNTWPAAHPEGGLRLVVCTALQKKCPAADLRIAATLEWFCLNHPQGGSQQQQCIQ